MKLWRSVIEPTHRERVSSASLSTQLRLFDDVEQQTGSLRIGRFTNHQRSQAMRDRLLTRPALKLIIIQN
ncbi:MULTISPECIES: hypothetical protein [unclassified Desertifilum]|uniref:hypothetical protein n=1 Tax=unclassified Desertifilum TaxID=2621682 RepID=UPI001681FBA4|nr:MULTISPECIES: hypothetical protein [unclassified Desertifilum]MBD2335297.1 hypothetical protein [Desertifilum sp. FACHB-868]